MNNNDDFWDSKKNRRKSKETIATLSSYISLIESKRPKDGSNGLIHLKGLLGQLEKTAIEKDLYYSPEEVEKRRVQASIDYLSKSDFGRGL
jgi:hypothetical protein